MRKEVRNILRAGRSPQRNALSLRRVAEKQVKLIEGENGGMNWPTQTPTTSGYYRWREPGSKDAYIVQIDVERQTVFSSPGTNKDASLGMMDGGEWYGPLKQPE